MTKKIESGCRCVIVNSLYGNNGEIVTVTRFVGASEGFPSQLGPLWEISAPLPDGWGRPCIFAGEQQLKPIDDDNEEAFERFKLACGIGEGVVA